MNNINSYKNILYDLIAKNRYRVDYLAIRLETCEGTNIQLRTNTTENFSETTSKGGQVRACHKGGWGFSSFDSFSHLFQSIEKAIGSAIFVGTNRTILAPVIPIQTTCELPLTSRNPFKVSLLEKKELCYKYNDILQTVSHQITTTLVSYNDSSHHVITVTSEGMMIDQSWIDIEMRFSAIAQNGENLKIGRETTGSREGYDKLTGLDKKVRSAATRAINALTMPSVKGGCYTVVIDPILTGLFVHEAFGHFSEADIFCKNPELSEVISLGRKFGPKILQIFDGAAPQGHRGSYFYDDEGVPATTTQLVENGLVVGRLHSRETAGKLNERPTGNARCLNYYYPPLVRMTNTWIERGKTPVKNLFDGIKKGVYAKNWLGGMTNGETYTFSAGEAWMIRNGQIAEPIRDVTLSGNTFKTLRNIEAIGNDFDWDESGGCCKEGQNGLPVGCGGPSLRINNIIIGGEI
ncbi:MAG: putative Zn-dependent protease-like protein [Candidatus Atelocyanobacterium thalassa isolate SIO64986]|uniref:Putative Zn-dependent protease-like protein n=1 Tax=Candidatus Atelocyanobacterium thalassa isolate SIO64986 TaxID=1527444 RepID=A0A086CIT8_9CHRO|nr:MAG: putative Zn-dependent protease-like protein [Candidatus Atelocyanobacterium thalassa isolate SIO64986]